MVSSAFVSVGGFFLCFCAGCAFLALNGRVRGVGRSKWWGVQEMRIDRPPLGGTVNRAYYPTSAGARVVAPEAESVASRTTVVSTGGFFASLPRAERPFDPTREALIG